MSTDMKKPESAVFAQAKQPLIPQGLESEDKRQVDYVESSVNVNNSSMDNNLDMNIDTIEVRANTNGGDALSNANVPIINDFHENSTASNNVDNLNLKDNKETTTTQGGKSLFAKAKDTLTYLKDTAMQIGSDLLKKQYKYSNPNEAPIIGMGRLEFQVTKLKLEKDLHLNGMKQFARNEESQQQDEKFDNTNQASFQQQDQQPLFDNNSQLWEQNQGTSTLLNQSAVTANQPLGAVQTSYQEVNREEFVKAPNALFQQTLVNDDKRDELQYLQHDKNEVHVLPSIKVQDKPIIIEKEVLYEKPVEIKQTIVHQEKPIIVEQPIIKQKFEHYRDNTQFESNQQKIITETNNTTNLNTENDVLLNLRKDRIDTFNDTTPLIQQQKENIQLDTEYREQPTIVNEKQVIYQQPVEIEQKFVEKITPVVRENVTLQKEHVYEKQAPQVFTDNVQQVQQPEQFFSNDASVTANTTATSNLNANAPSYTSTGATSDLDARKDVNYVAGQEQRSM